MSWEYRPQSDPASQLGRVGDQVAPAKIRLFYDYIGEGSNDFVDTYDAKMGAQDPGRFATCFDELERIARLSIEHIQRAN